MLTHISNIRVHLTGSKKLSLKLLNLFINRTPQLITYSLKIYLYVYQNHCILKNKENILKIFEK